MEIVSAILLALLLALCCLIVVLQLSQRHQLLDLRYTMRAKEQQAEATVGTQLHQLESEIQKELFAFRTQFQKSITEDFERLNARMEKKLLYLSDQVDQRLNKSVQQTNETFYSVLERLSKIDQAQQKIDTLSTNIMGLQDILNDKKARGAFGEIQLVNLFKATFGVNDQLYRTQYTLSNRTKVDLMLFAPEPMGNVAIDSKFPLENYQRLMKASPHETSGYERQFKQDVKKHIDDIALKYIIPGETAEYAILFLPAEAIFAYIHAYNNDIIEYAYQKKVWLTSPSTLMAMLSTLQVVLKNIEEDKYAKIIKHELELLAREFIRYQQRWESLVRHIEQVSKDVKDVNVTSGKITQRFTQIADVDFGDELLARHRSVKRSDQDE